MLYNSKEIKNEYKSMYQVNKALERKEIYKIEKGIYSDVINVNYLEIVFKKYPYAVITFDTAYYYYNLTDTIPKDICVATNRNSTTIHAPNLKQSRLQDNLYLLGKTQMEYQGVLINIYDRERLLIELARNKNNMGYDLYKEIITNYRKISSELDIQKIEEYLPYFNNGEKLFEIIQDEVF